MVTCKVEDDLVMDAFDMVGGNCYPGWYHEPGLGLGEPFATAKASMRRALETLHQKFNKPILVAEFGADCLAGLHSLPAEQWSEEYQADLIMTLIDVIRECDFVIGEHAGTSPTSGRPELSAGRREWEGRVHARPPTRR